MAVDIDPERLEAAAEFLSAMMDRYRPNSDYVGFLKELATFIAQLQYDGDMLAAVVEWVMAEERMLAKNWTLAQGLWAENAVAAWKKGREG